MSGPYKVLSSSPADLGHWQEYYERLEVKNVYSLPAYIKFLEAHYHDTASLFLYDEGAAFVYFPYFSKPLARLDLELTGKLRLDGRCHLYSSWYYGGPLAQPAAADTGFKQRFHAAWLRHAANCGAVSELTRFDANIGNQNLFPEHETSFDRATVFVDLTREQASIWRDFHQSNRWAVNRARRDGVDISIRSPQEPAFWQAFAGIYHDEMVRKNAPAHLYFGSDYFERLRTQLADHVCLVVSSLHGEMCGGVLLIFGDSHCFGFLSATKPEYWRSQVNNLGWAEAIWWAKSQGYRVFDLMGGRPGVFQDKSHFSKTRSRFYVRKAIYDRATFDQLVAARGRDGDGGGRPFPPFL